MHKNTAGQKVSILAYDIAASAGKTGDAANITAYISKDGAATAQSNDVNPTELDSTNMPGVYVFDLTAAETNCDTFLLYAKSTTEDIQINPVKVETSQPDDTHTWYVAKTGSDDNGGHSFSDALLTIGAAITAAASGDKIIIYPGTYGEQVDLHTAAKYLTLEGTSRAGCIITAAHSTILAYDKTVLIKLTINCTLDIGLEPNGDDIQIIDCEIYGLTDGIYTVDHYPSRLYMERCRIWSAWDGAMLPLAKDLLAVKCTFETTAATNAVCNAVQNPGSNSRYIDCIFKTVGTYTSANDANIVYFNSGSNRAIFTNCIFYMEVGSGRTGAVNGVKLGYSADTCKIENCIFTITASGASGIKDLNNTGAGTLIVSGCKYDTTKTSGTITDRAASIQTKTDTIVAGGATEANVNSKIAALNNITAADVKTAIEAAGSTIALINAKTTNLPASPAAVGSAMTVSDKTGFKLASDGLASVAPAEPSGDPAGWSFATKLIWLVYRFLGQHKKNDTSKKIEVYNPAGTKITEQTYTVSGNNETVEKVSQPS